VRLRTAARVALVPVALALALGACARPGTAATVNGVRITDAQLAAVASDYARLNLPADAPTVLSDVVATVPLMEAGERLGFGASREQAVALLDQTATANGVEPFEYSEPMIAIAQRVAMLSSIEDEQTQAELVSAFGEADITINPRFGTFDATTGLGPASWEWIIGSGSDAPAAG